MNRLASAAIAIAALLAIAAPFLLKPFGVYLISLWAVLTVAAIGLNLTLGYAGQVSLAQGAFVGIGAYTVALLTQAGYPFALAFIAAGLLCFIIGWLLGYPALRVQHHYLAFVTLAFTTLVFLLLRNEQWLTNGIYGINGIARPVFFGWSSTKPLNFYFFCLTALAVLSLATWWMLRSPWGRAFVALRENPIRAASLGVDTRRYTLMAFAIGSGLGGLAGALYAPLVQFIEPGLLLPEWMRVAEGYYLIVYAALIMVMMAFCPSGLLGLAERLFKPVARRGRLAPMLRAKEAAQ